MQKSQPCKSTFPDSTTWTCFCFGVLFFMEGCICVYFLWTEWVIQYNCSYVRGTFHCLCGVQSQSASASAWFAQERCLQTWHSFSGQSHPIISSMQFGRAQRQLHCMVTVFSFFLLVFIFDGTLGKGTNSCLSRQYTRWSLRYWVLYTMFFFPMNRPKQNSTRFAMACNPQSWLFVCCWMAGILTGKELERIGRKSAQFWLKKNFSW